MTTRRFAARGKERDGSAEFGSNLSRRLQSDPAPLLGPQHRQVGQALDAEPARKPTQGGERNGAPNRKRSATPGPNPLLDIGMTPTLAGFAPAMPDGSPPLATKRSDFIFPSELAPRQSCEGGPMARQVDPRKDMRSEPSEFPRQARSVQEVQR